MQQVHPLVADDVVPLQTWDKWMAAWKANTSIEVRASLLHCGFRVHGAGWRERIVFYLSIAETRKPRLEVHRERIDEARGKLALKALEVLCQEVFKQRRRNHEQIGWLNCVLDPETLDAILHFFRIEETEIAPVFENKFFGLSEHNREIMNTFLYELAQLGWQSSGWDDDIDEVGRQLLVSRRKQFVDLLFGLKQLWVLVSDRILSSAGEVDDVTLARLEELALEVYQPLPFSSSGSRKPQSVDEAAALGSQAARVLLIARVRNTELQRLRELSRIEEERRRLEARQQQLSAR